MTDNKKSHFKFIKSTKLEDLVQGVEKQIPESDLCIQTDDAIVQFEFVESNEERTKIKINPGCFSFESSSAGLMLSKLQLRKHQLLETIDNTSCIFSEANKFFSRLKVYESLKRDPKRAILLASAPGVGKTAAINKVCENFLKEDGTSVIIWDTSSVRSSSVNSFFLNGSEFTDKVKRMIFVIEDIGGGTTEEHYGGRDAESSLLNLLDGVGSPFKGVPTFIIATTNNPETKVAALIDRPGRFDKVIEMKTPNIKECGELLRFILRKDKLSEDEEKAMEIAAKEQFSIAHIQEVVVRSMLDDIDIFESTQQLVKHKKRFKNSFQETNKLGMGL